MQARAPRGCTKLSLHKQKDPGEAAGIGGLSVAVHQIDVGSHLSGFPWELGCWCQHTEGPWNVYLAERHTFRWKPVKNSLRSMDWNMSRYTFER